MRCGAEQCGAQGLERDDKSPAELDRQNMDLRKTLVSVLWILMLNIEEDCHAEEGMLFNCCCAAAGCVLIDRQIEEIVWLFVL